jgi:hypothetical protein
MLRYSKFSDAVRGDPYGFSAPNPSKVSKACEAVRKDSPLGGLANLDGLGKKSASSSFAARTELVWVQSAPSVGLNYKTPCSERRGRVENADGAFLHFCAECGAWGAYGYGVDPRAGHLGVWFCAEHRR